MRKRQEPKRERQVAAIPLRLNADGQPEILLVTSRGTGRWVAPKGGRMKGLKDHEAAAVEAEEEAGVSGQVRRKPLGAYNYWRRTDQDFRLTKVSVFVLRVDDQRDRWKEDAQRQRRWVGILEGADLVAEPELSTIIVRLPTDQDVLRFLRRKR